MKKAGLRISLTMLLVITISLSVFSQQSTNFVNKETAIKAANNFLPAATKNSAKSTELKSYKSINNTNGENCIHVLNYADGGYVLVSSDKRAVPVLGWSDEGEFDFTNAAPATKLWIDKYVEQFEIIEAANLMPSDQVTDMWKRVLTGQYRNDTKGVAKLVLTKWNQDSPYNMYCPEHTQGPGGRTYAGCIATTMAQIMNYWEYPAQGKGEVSYFWGEYFDIDLEQYTYDYSIMPNSFTIVTPLAQKQEVAKLMFHCGVAAKMDYNYDGSSSSNFNAWWAFKQNYKYRSGVYMQDRDTTDNAEWKFKLKYDLDLGRPIMYRGTDDDNNGHSFVCDGYQDTSYFHFNWGWGGSNDGFYYLDEIDPQMEFHWAQGAILNLTPKDAPYCNNATFVLPEFTFNDGSGPNYYFNNTSCNWLIEPSVRDYEYIKLSFNKFSLLPGDTLTIWKGNANNGVLTLVGKFSDRSPGEITTTGDKFFLEFTTNGEGQADGWEAHYQTVLSGINNISENSFSVYPNPADNYLIIDGIYTDEMVSIMDISGKLIMNTKSNGNNIDISALNAGLYIISINQNNNIHYTKFIKK